MKYLFLLLLPSLAFAKSFIPASFSANFEESFVSVASGKEKKSYGKIDYKYPGNIRFEKTSPDPSTFISNPKQSWYYVPPFVQGEQGQVTITKSSNLPLTKFLDSIKNGIEGSKLFAHKYQGNDLVLTFKPDVQKEMTLKEVILHGKKDAKNIEKLSEINHLSLTYHDGRKVSLRFIDLKENATFPADHFVFKVPANTKTTNQ